ncbi:unnamed protein product [Rangifer tarandus platyrhynchus]|uniref:Uncharacterized protein n=1 Tax=Rangifer tarandus platyrhynchus TaxID=3082113 RepID=A0AC59ZFI5_RANTA
MSPPDKKSSLARSWCSGVSCDPNLLLDRGINGREIAEPGDQSPPTLEMSPTVPEPGPGPGSRDGLIAASVCGDGKPGTHACREHDWACKAEHSWAWKAERRGFFFLIPAVPQQLHTYSCTDLLENKSCQGQKRAEGAYFHPRTVALPATRGRCVQSQGPDCVLRAKFCPDNIQLPRATPHVCAQDQLLS